MSESDGDLTFHIPLVEITSKDAKLIRDTKEQVVMKLSTSKLSPKNQVEVDLWYSSSLDLGLKLSDELAALSYSFMNDHSKKPLFTPRIATFSCQTCPDDFKTENCLSNGTYCAYTPKFFDEYKLKNSAFEMTGR